MPDEIRLKILGEKLLNNLQDSYLNYTESSAAIYEVNGDYAAALFTSRWCDFLNQASKELAGDVSEKEALKSGKWICHKDCWSTSLKSIKEEKPYEAECSGGIVIYAVPIIVKGMVIGSNNAGVSNPPTDKKKVSEIAERYKVDPAELLKIAKEYEQRPEYVFKAVRNHILTVAETISDILSHKLLEKELKEYYDQLEETVKLRTSEFETRVAEVETLNRGMVNLAEDFHSVNSNLEKTTQQLQVANKELESFSYSVSHDLRAPLRAIDGFSKILMEDYDEKLDEEGQRILKVVTDNTQKMGKLIDDILSLSRLGRRAMKFQTVDLNKVVQGIQKEIMADTSDRTIHWQNKKLPNIHADLMSIRQVFLNLLSNAVKFTSTRKTAKIEVGSKTKNDEILFYVKDNGVGFKMKYVDKIFEVFQRLHRDEEFSGTGVGLAIVRRIVQRHGGRFWAEAEVDKGTTIFIALPQKGENQ